MKTQNGNTGKAFKLSVTTLAIMNITAVVSLRGLPSEAIYGLSSAFYYLFAAIVFLIPTSMVAAELAAMFSDKQGGVFRWVGEAFGPRTGFLAIWLTCSSKTSATLWKNSRNWNILLRPASLPARARSRKERYIHIKIIL